MMAFTPQQPIITSASASPPVKMKHQQQHQQSNGQRFELVKQDTEI